MDKRVSVLIHKMGDPFRMFGDYLDAQDPLSLEAQEDVLSAIRQIKNLAWKHFGASMEQERFEEEE